MLRAKLLPVSAKSKSNGFTKSRYQEPSAEYAEKDLPDDFFT